MLRERKRWKKPLKLVFLTKKILLPCASCIPADE